VQQPGYSSPGGRLSRLISDRRRLASRRLRRAAGPGLTGRLAGGSGLRASSSTARSRCLATWRFLHWDRWSSTTTRTAPERSLPSSRLWIRSFSRSVSAVDLRIEKVSPTRVFARLTCCPPGPEEGPKSQRSSRAGMTGPRWSTRSRFEFALMLSETSRMKASRQNPWILAARPRTLWAAVAPVLVGCGLAAGSGVFRIDAMAAALICALSFQVAANFANDVSDARRGADPETRIGPTRAVATGLLTSRQVWVGAWTMFAMAAVCGLYIASITSWVVVGIGAVAILATLTYTGGPSPYGYRGLGEISVFVFFGLVATVGTRYAHDGTAPLEAWLLAIPVGLTASAILVANNVRDIDTDEAAGKRTLAVALGRNRARTFYTVIVATAFVVTAAVAAVGVVPRWTALALFTAPLAVPLIRSIRATTDGPALITVLEGTARLHLLVGIGLGIGAAIG